MNFATMIAVAALAVIISLAVIYIVREKRRGVKCIGCPLADSCTKYGGRKRSGHHSKTNNQ
jgi:hypothetical protein